MILLPSTLKQVEWDSDDRQMLAAFLSTATGQKVLDTLSTEEPSFYDGENATQALTAAGRVQGYQDAVKALLKLIQSAPKVAVVATTDEYPDPEDDAAWGQDKDGKPLHKGA